MMTPLSFPSNPYLLPPAFWKSQRLVQRLGTVFGKPAQEQQSPGPQETGPSSQAVPSNRPGNGRILAEISERFQQNSSFTGQPDQPTGHTGHTGQPATPANWTGHKILFNFLNFYEKKIWKFFENFLKFFWNFLKFFWNFLKFFWIFFEFFFEFFEIF